MEAQREEPLPEALAVAEGEGHEVAGGSNAPTQEKQKTQAAPAATSQGRVKSKKEKKKKKGKGKKDSTGKPEQKEPVEEKRDTRLSDKVASNDDDWKKKLPHVSLMSPHKELDWKIKHQLKASKELGKKKEKEDDGETTEELKNKASSFLSVRNSLLDYLSIVKEDWNCIAVSIATDRMKDYDTSMAEVEKLFLQYLNAGRDLGDASVCDFAWMDLSSEIVSDSISFDIVNMAVCVALWYMVHGASIAKGAIGEESPYFKSLEKRGTPAPYARFASGVFRKAAGLLQYAAQISTNINIDKILGQEELQDCSRKAIDLLYAICISDAQSIAVSTAIERESNPTLIASLAFFSNSVLNDELSKGDGSGVKGFAFEKWLKYAEYKATQSKAIGYAYQGLSLLEQEEGGKARRCSQQALEYLSLAIDFSSAYHSKKPKTDSTDDAQYHQELRRLLQQIDRRTERENAIVYMRAVPVELPPPIEKKGITPAITMNDLPPSEGYQEAKEEQRKEGESKFSCLKCVATCICMPLLLLISLIGFIVSILLLPCKLVCCPCGMILQGAWNLIEWMLKAPLRAIQWSAGKEPLFDT